MKRKTNNGAGVSSLAQSEEVGLLLVFSITITSMGVILMMGVPALNDAKENAQIQRVETEFGSLDRQISKAAFGGGQTQARVNIQQGDFSFEPDAGWINISYYNGSTTFWENKSLPAIRYTHTDSMISYQGGGIWTKYGDGSTTMSSPPDINLQGNTLNIALINITSGGFQTAGARDLFTFTHNGSHRMQEFRDLGPLSVGSLNLTIHSRHYRGWARYFNQTGWPTVKIYSTNNTVHAKNPTGSPPFGQAILSSGQIVQFSGSGSGVSGKVDSYDSRVGNYSSNTSLGAGNVKATNEIRFQHETIVNGTVSTESSVTCSGCGGSKTNIITGDAISGDPAPGGVDDSLEVHGDELEGMDVSVEVPAPIEGTITDAVNEFTTDFSSSISSCGGSCSEITSGEYIENSNFGQSGGTFRFDTTNGPILVALTNSEFTFTSGATVEVVGDNPVIIFRDSANSANAFKMEDVRMDVEDNRTDLFQVYADPSTAAQTKVRIRTSTEYFGVIYAPNNQWVVIEESEVFGSVIGQKVKLDDSDLHFDHSLVELDLPSIGAERISYLHASDNRVGAR